MASPDFIITNTGITKQINDHRDNEIDMITRPAEGALMIADLYESCDMDKPTRFKFILAWFSEPSLDFREIQGTPDEETMMRDCLNQWSFLSSCYDRGFRQHFNDNDEVETTTKETTTTCACSQNIENRYYFRNKLNSNVLLIGSSCLKKFASETTMAEDYLQVRKILRPCDNCGETTPCTDIVNGFCRVCYPDDITEEDKTICLACLNLRLCKFGRCKKCYKEEKPRLVIVNETQREEVHDPKTQKTCTACQQTFHALEDWKKICPPCYKQQREDKTKQGTSRECQHCKQEFLTDQDWKKTCSGCYKLLSKVCIKCNQGFIPKGTWQKVCYKCWQAGQKK